MLTRIYGTAFFSKDELEEHLERLEQARRATTAGSARSSACSRSPSVAPGSAFWLPAGTTIFNELVGL